MVRIFWYLEIKCFKNEFVSIIENFEKDAGGLFPFAILLELIHGLDQNFDDNKSWVAKSWTRAGKTFFKCLSLVTSLPEEHRRMDKALTCHSCGRGSSPDMTKYF